MHDNDERAVNDTKSTIAGLIFTAAPGTLLGYWAFVLDPSGNGGSILIIPVTVVLVVSCPAFLFTGLILRNESLGPWLILASIAMPIIFLVTMNSFRAALGS
jgi:hypothetical protein